LLVAEPVPEFAFEPADGHEVLWRAGVLVRGAGKRGKQQAGQVRELGHVYRWELC